MPSVLVVESDLRGAGGGVHGFSATTPHLEGLDLQKVEKFPKSGENCNHQEDQQA
jgi:hypothetical protein